MFAHSYLIAFAETQIVQNRIAEACREAKANRTGVCQQRKMENIGVFVFITLDSNK